MTDKTNFAQSLMHMIKGNLGTGILAMPATFAHCGIINSSIGLPLLCIVATYCVHLLVRSSQHLESKMKSMSIDYAELAKGAFKAGPDWMKPWSGIMCRLVDAILIINQMGICCVYLVFIVENITTIFSTYNIKVDSIYLFFAVLPFILLLSYIKTLKRLSIASACANALQVVGIGIIISYLIRNMPNNYDHVENFRPISEVALGFGAAMFAFEGISVVLPIYARMKRPEQIGGLAGTINLSYIILLVLYFTIGCLGYLKFGHNSEGSITINLPKEPLYDIVRGIFVVALFLTYPLQFYVPNEIIWNWAQSKFFTSELDKKPAAMSTLKATASEGAEAPARQNQNYEYVCRTILVMITFVLAITIPRLNLMMDLVGSISGTALSVIMPPLIHIAAFWEDTSGPSKVFMLVVDMTLISIGVLASASGSYFSFIGILRSFGGSPEALAHS